MDDLAARRTLIPSRPHWSKDFAPRFVQKCLLFVTIEVADPIVCVIGKYSSILNAG